MTRIFPSNGADFSLLEIIFHEFRVYLIEVVAGANIIDANSMFALWNALTCNLRYENEKNEDVQLELHKIRD